MQIVVLANEALKNELLGTERPAPAPVRFLHEVAELEEHRDADAVIDLLFDAGHLPALQSVPARLTIISSVSARLADTDPSFVRINGWPTFLSGPLIEAAALNEEHKEKAAAVFSVFDKKLEWLPDEPGFVTPRIISMIINEAFIALEEGVSTKEDIDTAMKLGTNYPYGPFEWAERIGRDRIKSLLETLARHHPRYTPFIF